MKKITVYYAGQVYREYLDIQRIWPLNPVSKELREESLEIYNGCHIHTQGYGRMYDGWFRGDQTPLLDADVPKELKLLALIST